ncbi:methyl-accepting chemotaxis protein [Fodinisporobacter ferrooxydans]|uniref:Methyl-accepting chemotaxis protein n=1 Tax=Fodinisporobacter ferrooxydans TaxID=2901836 RepID=A0ABY4CFM2_9BACL|nr:methyl-accepting chemotaxis protein [Alicyclobacillaceae bacterium MYW30-H2]
MAMKGLTIKNRLIGSFAAILIIPSITIGYLSYSDAQTQIKQQLVRSADQNVGLLNSIITNTLKGKFQDLDRLSKLITQTDYQGNETSVAAQKLENYAAYQEDIKSAFVVTNTGDIITPSTQKLPGNFNPKTSTWYQEAMRQKGKVILSGPFVNPADKSLLVTIAKTTADDSGVIGMNFNLKNIADQTKNIKFGNQGYIVVYDENKKFLIHPTIAPGKKIPAYDDGLYRQKSGTVNYMFNGQPKMMIFDTNPLTGWKIAGNMSTSEITDLAYPILYKSFFVTMIALIIGGLLVYFIIRSILRPLKHMLGVSKKISQGDLTEKLEINSNDELSQLSLSFNTMSDSLRSIVSEIGMTVRHLASSSEELSASTEQTSRATEQIAASIQEVSAGSQQQAKDLEQASQTVSEMASGIQQISYSSETVSTTAAETSEATLEGNKAIHKAINQMNSIHTTVLDASQSIKELGDYAKNIDTIVEVITNISSQTNLLALNAAIEAARAGEHGRGFAVVADEVRKLAEQSQNSAKQISDYIATIQVGIKKAVESMDAGTKEVNSGIEVVNLAKNSFGKISTSVDEVFRQIQEVSATTEQMSAGAEEIVRVVDRIVEASETTSSATQTVSAATEEQLASMEEISSFASTLAKTAEELQSVINKFRV